MLTYFFLADFGLRSVLISAHVESLRIIPETRHLLFIGYVMESPEKNGI